jgi:hypothetical protein
MNKASHISDEKDQMEPTEATFSFKEAMYILNNRPQKIKDEIPFFESKKARKFVQFYHKSKSFT